MIDYFETAGRWLTQAEDDLTESTSELTSGKFAYACFFAEQSAQKALKSYLISKKELQLSIHSISALSKKASIYDPVFQPIIEEGKSLDKYYLSTRYPDALPAPLIPSQAHSKLEAEQAVELARVIFKLCAERVKRA